MTRERARALCSRVMRHVATCTGPPQSPQQLVSAQRPQLPPLFPGLLRQEVLYSQEPRGSTVPSIPERAHSFSPSPREHSFAVNHELHRLPQSLHHRTNNVTEGRDTLRIGSCRSTIGGPHSCLLTRRASPHEEWRWNLLSSQYSTQATQQEEEVHITDSCIQRLHALAKEEGKPVFLRLTVEGGGCSGFQYIFTLDDKPKEGDRVIERDGATLLVDDITLNFVRGAQVDFSEELIRSSFEVIKNPYAASSCGCGASFVAKKTKYKGLYSIFEDMTHPFMTTQAQEIVLWIK